MTPVDIPKSYEETPALVWNSEEPYTTQEVTTNGFTVKISAENITENNTITVSITGKSCLVETAEDEQAIKDDPTCNPLAQPLNGQIAIQIINEDSGTTTLPPVIVDINQQDGTWQFNEKVNGSPGRYSININPVDVENGLICSGTTITYIVGAGGVIKLENPTTQTACFAIVNPYTGETIYFPLIN